MFADLVDGDDSDSATVFPIESNVAPLSEALWVGAGRCDAAGPLVGDDGAGATILNYFFGRDVARRADESGVWLEVA